MHIALLSRLQLDPSRQLVAAQCSGTLILAKLDNIRGYLGTAAPAIA